ncbi:hypothetical protein HB770_04060 [Rhizobium leguminosarum bv. viciae]|uniref:Uncharacterized protein n=1 Tax=Rhizobium leguminosarum bv. viciae TaxID=387 RepID=A0A7G6RHT8_RHILV|nr:hypothetical protein HB770_04060 [Rhizobium leguminosarum bv. viciae]
MKWGIPPQKYWSRAFTKLAPQADRRHATYFGTDRGTRSIRYAINRLRRSVTLRARCAQLSFSIPYDQARAMSCADSIRIEVPRVGEVVGKIVSIERQIQRKGRSIANIRIASTNGDGTAAPAPGEEQEQTGDLAYGATFPRLYEPVNALALDGMGPFANFVENDAAAQEAFARDASSAGLDPIAAIGKNPTRLTIAFPSLREEDLLTRRITVRTEALRLPKQIKFLEEA